MVMGLLKVLRMYMGMDAEMIADTIGMTLERYIDIENGDLEPDASELKKLSSVFCMDEDVLTGESSISNTFVLSQPLDASLFATEEQREMMKLRMTDLSPEEKRLILLIRASENRPELMEKITDILNDEIF